MAGRGSQTFQKRQKEQQRRERQQEKFAKKMEKKLRGPSDPNEETEGSPEADTDGTIPPGPEPGLGNVILSD